MRIPLIKPFMNDKIKQRVLDVLDSGIFTEGSVTSEFEGRLREIIGCQYTIAVSSCTTGLELALRCLNIGTDDEIIIPDYTYPATADVISIVGARTIIVDVDPDTMLIDYEKIKKAITPNTKAIMPVSIFGNPLNYEKLNAIKKEFGLYIIEDSACSLGSSYQGVKTGNLADISVFSHHPRKFITTGEGGLVTTNNKAWYEWMHAYKHFGITQSQDRKETAFTMIGTNYKMPNVLAAVGVGQLEYYDELLKRRQEIAQNYITIIKAAGLNVQIPKTTEKGIHSYQSFCVFTDKRDELIGKMREKEIEVQIGTYSLSLQPAFQNNSTIQINSCSNSQKIFERVLTLPLYHELQIDTQKYIIDTLKGFLK